MGKETYTITYNVNAEGVTGTVPSAQTPKYMETVNVQFPTLTKTGYTFQGWARVANASDATYKPGGTNTSFIATENVTLYAVWTINSYKLTYYSTDGGTQLAQETKNYGATVTASAAKTSKTCYLFAGWATQKNGTTVAYKADDTITFTGNVNLYEVWKDTQVYIAEGAEMSDGLKGYAVGTKINPSSYIAILKDTSGREDKMYFPYAQRKSNCEGYWIATPTGYSNTNVIVADISNVAINSFNYGADSIGICPVIYLSSSVLAEQLPDLSWNLR